MSPMLTPSDHCAYVLASKINRLACGGGGDSGGLGAIKRAEGPLEQRKAPHGG